MNATGSRRAINEATIGRALLLACCLLAAVSCSAASHASRVEADGQRSTATQSATSSEVETKEGAAAPEQTSETERPSKVETADERKQALEGELDQSLTEFDGYLLREQKLLDERRQTHAASGGGGEGEGEGDGVGAGSENGGLEGEEDGEAGADSGAIASRRSRSRAGGSGNSDDDPEMEPSSDGAPVGGSEMSDQDNGRVPPDVGDGDDDDIVARQLREAAMQEEDPVLREKLWDEYRSYKGIEKNEDRHE